MGDPWVIFSIPATISFSLRLPVAFPLAGSQGQGSRVGKYGLVFQQAVENSNQNMQCFFPPLVWHFSILKFPWIINTLSLSSWITISQKWKSESLQNSELPTIDPSCNNYLYIQDPDQCTFIRQEYPNRTWGQAFPLHWKYWREGLYL